MNVEAYILVRNVKDAQRVANGVGDFDTLSFIEIPIYEDLESCEKINVSGLIVSVNGFHKAIDESTLTVFEASDLSLTLSLIRSDNDVERLGITDSDAFYNKLLTNSLYLRIQELAHRNGLDKHVRWDFSIYFSDVDIKFYGTIDLQSIEINESNGNCTFTVYDSMKSLDKIPAFGVHKFSTFTPYYSDVEDFFYQWYTGVSPETALDLVESFMSPTTNEFLPKNVDLSDSIDYDGWTLSFYGEGFIPDSLDSGARVLEISYDGQGVVLITSDSIYRIDSDSAFEELSIDGLLAFEDWQPATHIDETPPLLSPTGLARQTGGGIIDVDDYTKISQSFYDPEGEYLYYFYIDQTNENWYLRRYEWQGYTGSTPTWGALDVVATIAVSGKRGHGNYLQPIAVTNLGYVYFATGRRVAKYSGGSTEWLLGEEYRNEKFFNGLRYYENNNIILCILYSDYNIKDTIDQIIVLNATTGDVIDDLYGEIEPRENFDDYNLEYKDIDWDSVFEIKLSELDEPSATHFAGLTRGKDKRFFILDETLKFCILYTNLSNALGAKYATQAKITRVLEDVEDIRPDGSIVTRQYNAVFGYIGNGVLNGTTFFKYSMTHSGNIRSLNLDKMSMREAYTEIAKFSNSYFFIDHNITDFDGKNIAQPFVNIVSRRDGREDAVEYGLDRLWSSWKWKAQYKNYLGVIETKYNGGTTETGASVDTLVTYDSHGLPSIPLTKTLIDVYGIPRKSIEFKLIFDHNFAKHRGNEYVYFYWDAKQLWTINTEIKNFRLIDFVRLRYSEGGRYDRTAQIIAIDFYPTTKKAVIKAITTNEQLSVPPNPLIQTSYLPNQLGDIGQGNV